MKRPPRQQRKEGELLVATNRVKESANRLALPVPDGTVSGDPLVLGALPCVAVTDQDEWTEGEASVQTDGSWRYPVVGDDGAPAAIEVGDIIYLDSGVLSSDDSGDRFGYALEPVGSGDTTEIEVKVGY